MRVALFGVRGSTPSPGQEFVRYGGNTSCVAISHDGRPPSLVLDAGTGLPRLARHLPGGLFEGTIMLGHLHWDHTHGLPFFAAALDPSSRIRLLFPAQGDAEGTLARVLSPPHFPIRPRELEGDWEFACIETGDHEFEGFTIHAEDIPHKGGRTFGYRVTDGRASLAYLSDHSPITAGPGPAGQGEYHRAARALADGVDLLIHDAQHTEEEFSRIAHFGHSTMDYAVGLAEACGVKRLLLFHHDPARTDDDLDANVARFRDRAVRVEGAAEGMVIDLP